MRSLGAIQSTPQPRVPLRPSGAPKPTEVAISNRQSVEDIPPSRWHSQSHSPSAASHVGRRRPSPACSTSVDRGRHSLPPSLEGHRGSKHVASRTPSPAEPSKRVKALKWRNNVAPTQNCAKASDYESIGYRIILEASHDFMARVATQNLYPELKEQLSWSLDAFRKECEKVEEDFEPTDRILGLVSGRNSILYSIWTAKP